MKKKNLLVFKISKSKIYRPYLFILFFLSKEIVIEVRVDLTVLCKSINSEEIKEELKWVINGIDMIGCGLSQNISKKLKENK